MDNNILLQSISIDELAAAIAEKLLQHKPKNDVESILNVEEAAKLLRMSVPTIWRLKASGEIPYRKIGSRVVFMRDELISWVK